MINFSRFILVAGLVMAFLPGLAQDIVTIKKGTFYLVRHAEKDTGRNPRLSEEGVKRAGDLYRRLRKQRIRQIYTTNFRRTMMTGDSMRIYQHPDTFYYAADTTGFGLMKSLKQHFRKKSHVLVIGHSNTVPVLLRRLGVKNIENFEMPETQYNMLFIVKIRRKKVVSFIQEQYGQWAP
ncbi:histidine phosphatase family protein [Ferruginibacter sp. HRS2-29]|uniref:histidine phosphatase family protein n=1 Tax=Ferruginibacter sp. HRS2-29 TaxID=2487334 RepID=UPI0020CBBE1E|nr:histidine phosphatase family protein [Ferruginibacter sp. HRS2-29]MCP9750818.1 histidine phosphatase family protein [Ferruginibacter sp. HRS2-29]